MYDEWQAEYEAMMDAKAKAEYEEYCYYEAKKDYLVQLLNEYEISLDSQPYWTRNRVSISEEMVISKKLWFIKRLVNNNKIDNSKLSRESDMWFWDKYEREESLLMLLAISDNPIEDLISMLK